MSGLTLDVVDSLREFELRAALEVEEGSCTAIVGPSGAGKTTVLRIVAGLRRPTSGRVAVDAEPWLDTAEGIDLPAEGRRCGFLFQQYALFPHLSAWRNVAFGVEGDRGRRRSRAEELLGRFGLEALAEARPQQLSGGERQRVALARALAREPRALLLDEPLSALDARTRGRAGRELAAALAEAGAPSLVVTHDFSEAALLADQVLVMDRGEVVQRGTPAELSAQPASAFVADFAGSVVLSGRVTGVQSGVTLVELDGGGTVASTDEGAGEVAVSVYPWEIALELPSSPPRGDGSALNRVETMVESVAQVGNRVRVGLLGPQPLAAEVTATSVERLGIRPGKRVDATWKATATRLVAR